MAVDVEENVSEDNLSVPEKLAIMRKQGWRQIIPNSSREVRLRTVEPADLLRSGDCPDILTPLMLKGIYQELSDKELREWLEKPLVSKEEALAYSDMLTKIAELSLVGDTVKVAELTQAERKWIFRFALGAAEMLVFFRYEPPKADVAPVAQGEPGPSTS